jgi:hypothetical protein
LEAAGQKQLAKRVDKVYGSLLKLVE